MKPARGPSSEFVSTWAPKAQLSLESLRPPEPPRFPTFLELVEEDRRAPGASPRVKGFFRELLADNVQVLLEDAMLTPEKYGPETMHLLETLAGRKPGDLTEDERRAMDGATLTFATHDSPRPKTTSTPPPVAAETPAAVHQESDQPVPGIDIPEGAASPFWWLK